MRAKAIVVMAVLGLLTVPALAGAAAQLTATGVRITNYAVKVRVVVDSNGTIGGNEVDAGMRTATAADAGWDQDGAMTASEAVTGSRLHLALQPATAGLTIGLDHEPHRREHIWYKVLTGHS